MDIHIQKHILFISLLAVILFSGCSNSLTEIKKSSATVVFNYDTVDSLPAARLCVFAEPTEEVRKCESIRVTSISEGLNWQTDEIIKLQNGNKFYAGYNNFVLPDGIIFPSGEYEVCYIEADQKETYSSCNVIYEKDLYNTKASDISSFLKNKNCIKKLAVFDINNTLLYFGDNKAEYNSKSGILRKFKSAEYIKNIWCSLDNSYYCVMPPEKLIETEN